MSKEARLDEDDIWAYRSIRKPKSQSQNDAGDCTQTYNGKSKSKRRRRKETESTSKNTEKAKRGSQGIPELTPEKSTLVPNWNRVTKSQNSIKSPAQPCSTKQSSQTLRPLHDGHCPNCQMPFSVLLVQTPRWHVDECLDAIGPAEKECPDGLQCSSTIPSHYKKFTHFQLARSRAGTSLTSGDVTASEAPGACAGAAKADTSDGGVIGHVQSLPPSSESISYSPLGSDEEGDGEENVKHLRKRLFCVRPSEDGHKEKEGGLLGVSANDGQCGEEPCKDWNKACYSNSAASQTCSAAEIVNLKEEPDWPGFGSPVSHDGQCGEEPCKDWNKACSSNSAASQTCSAAEIVNIKEEPDWPGFGSPVSHDGEGDRKDPEAATWLFRDLSSRATPLSKKVKAEEEMSVQSMLSSPSQQSQSGFNFKEVCGSSPVGSDGVVSPSQFPVLQSGAVKEESLPLTQSTAERLLNLHVKKVRSVCVDPNTKATPPKVLKQTDIGVFFGLQPKAKEEKAQEGNLSQRSTKATSGGTPKGNRAGQRKRKAGGSVGDTDAVPGAPQSSGAPLKASGRGQQGWPKRFREADGTEGESGKRQCPFYKTIPGTGFTVDAFQFGKIEGCTAYFLTHFHSDHYGGLTKKFQCPIYCSKITGNLVRSKLRVEERFIHTLPMDTECVVEGVKVVLLEANHCPGAVLLLFCLPNGSAILHTGDFRADPSMEQYPALIGRKIHSLYLDTTYCSPEYTFPPQQEAIQFAATTAFETVTLYPRTLVVCGTYSVGKEKVFLAVADVLGCKVCMSQDKYKTLQCLESKEISSQITTDWNSTSLHVLPMMQVNFKGLLSHLNKFSGRYDRVLAFKPTGWTYSDGCASVADIKPTVRGKITTYGIPYSEHSSYLEMKRFVQWLRPQKIIPTVNMGNWKTRTTMEKYFSQWMLEPAPKRGITS